MSIDMKKKMLRSRKVARLNKAVFVNNLSCYSYLPSNTAGKHYFIELCLSLRNVPLLLSVPDYLMHMTRTKSVSKVARWFDCEVTMLSFKMKFSSKHVKRFKTAESL